MVDEATIVHICQLYISPGHPIFDLVPGPLNMYLTDCYNSLGRPPVTHTTIWHVYLDVLCTVQESAIRLPPPLPMPAMIEESRAVRSLPLIEDQCDLPFDKADGVEAIPALHREMLVSSSPVVV